MIRQDWAKYNDDLKQVAGVCSSWLWGRVPSMTLEDFRAFGVMVAFWLQFVQCSLQGSSLSCTVTYLLHIL